MADNEKIAQTNALDLYDNHNIQDQNRTAIIFFVVFIVIIGSLIGMGNQHAHEPGANEERLSVHKAIGSVEWPGNVGHQGDTAPKQGESAAQPAAAPPAP